MLPYIGVASLAPLPIGCRRLVNQEMINDFYLVVTDDEKVFNLRLTSQKYMIGRNINCDVILPFTFVSRFHCTLVLDQTADQYSYTLWDGIPLRNPSTAGTFLNGDKIDRPVTLKDGDKITFGRNKEIPSIHFVVENPDNHEGTVSFEA